MIVNPIDIHIAKKLRTIRNNTGMSLILLGELLGVTSQQIQKYEKGLNRVSASTLFEISQIFDTSISYFFEDYKVDSYHNYEFKDVKEMTIPTYDKKVSYLLRLFNNIEKEEVKSRLIDLMRSLSNKR